MTRNELSIHILSPSLAERPEVLVIFLIIPLTIITITSGRHPGSSKACSVPGHSFFHVLMTPFS